MSKTCIVIAGPTAVGKTDVAINVAHLYKTEIISADSRQCYAEMKIGVARPSEDQLQSVPHHFIASHSIQDRLNAVSFEKYALDKINDLFLTNDVVVVTGGTGLYIRALCDGLDPIPEVPIEIRNAIIDGSLVCKARRDAESPADDARLRGGKNIREVYRFVSKHGKSRTSFSNH
jgi:tRNA dimethylallyltransferase